MEGAGCRTMVAEEEAGMDAAKRACSFRSTPLAQNSVCARVYVCVCVGGQDFAPLSEIQQCLVATGIQW